ncbi:MAG TPA: hypothetical protein VFG14_16370 [Chthoniobacteraceae bacterium]|nr:hypothetical protein [Chthoniobacteraceae bacterium]
MSSPFWKRKVGSLKVAEWAAVLGMMVALGVPSHDFFENAKYRVRDDDCRERLKALGNMFYTFANDNPGREPKGWWELFPLHRDPRSPACMLTGWKPARPGMKFDHARASYVCCFDANLRDDEPRCWDRAPHRPNHIFLFLNGPRRNVLMSGGRVVTLDERRFQALDLTGQETVLPR